MISRCLGNNFYSKSMLHFSRASGKTVWFVYEKTLYARSNAKLSFKFSSSIKIRKSSTIARAKILFIIWKYQNESDIYKKSF